MESPCRHVQQDAHFRRAGCHSRRHARSCRNLRQSASPAASGTLPKCCMVIRLARRKDATRRDGQGSRRPGRFGCAGLPSKSRRYGRVGDARRRPKCRRQGSNQKDRQPRIDVRLRGLDTCRLLGSWVRQGAPLRVHVFGRASSPRTVPIPADTGLRAWAEPGDDAGKRHAYRRRVITSGDRPVGRAAVGRRRVHPDQLVAPSAGCKSAGASTSGWPAPSQRHLRVRSGTTG